MSVVETERTGIMKEFYDDETGVITEDGTGSDYDFARPGAQRDFKIGDGVIFITITTPNGRKIVKSIQNK